MGRGELFSAFIEHARGLLKLPPSDNTSHGRTQLNISKIPLLHVISSFFVCLYAFFSPRKAKQHCLIFCFNLCFRCQCCIFASSQQGVLYKCYVSERERENFEKLHFVDGLHKVDLYTITRYSLSCSLKEIVCLMLTAWHTFIISKKQLMCILN